MNPLLLGPIFDIGKTLIERFFPDPEKKREAEMELVRMAAAGELQQVVAQLEINAREAQHPSIFVAGWRPAVGWVCVAAMAFQYLARPLLIAYNVAPADLPGLDDNLWAILTGILGIGGLRSIEKLQKVTK
jgi:hypothetical protein